MPPPAFLLLGEREPCTTKEFHRNALLGFVWLQTLVVSALCNFPFDSMKCVEQSTASLRPTHLYRPSGNSSFRNHVERIYLNFRVNQTQAVIKFC